MSRTLLLFCLLAAGCVSSCGPEGKLRRAEAALIAGDLTTAEASFRGVLDTHPDDPDALYGLGWVYHLNGDEDRAREYFKRCVRVAAQDWRGHRGLGSVALAEGNLVLAEQHLGDARELAPGEPRVLSSLALVYLSSERPEQALPLLEQAQELAPERGEYGYNLAEAQLGLKQHDAALATVDAALSSQIREQRFRALLLEMRARVLVVKTGERVDPERCEQTAPPVMAWLQRADRALDQAEALDIKLDSLPQTRRLVHRRRSAVTETCPGAQPGDGK